MAQDQDFFFSVEGGQTLFSLLFPTVRSILPKIMPTKLFSWKTNRSPFGQFVRFFETFFLRDAMNVESEKIRDFHWIDVLDIIMFTKCWDKFEGKKTTTAAPQWEGRLHARASNTKDQKKAEQRFASWEGRRIFGWAIVSCVTWQKKKKPKVAINHRVYRLKIRFWVVIGVMY